MNCMLCNGSKIEKLYDGKDLLIGVEGKFQLVGCRDCGLAWVAPELSNEEMEAHYPAQYISYPKAAEDEKNPITRRLRKFGIEKRVRRVIARTSQAGTVLDIGCATGGFLNGMQEHGWTCYGVEPSSYAAGYARQRFGLNVFHGYLKDASYPENFFDVITLWDVLEHIAHPKEDLAIIYKILKPGGLLTISMPNSDAWERFWFGKYWAGWDVPRHYYIYNQTNIGRLLSQCGFQVEGISSFTGRHGVLALSIEFWMRDHSLPGWLNKGISGFINSPVARAITYPYYSVADRFNKSSIMTVFASKKPA